MMELPQPRAFGGEGRKPTHDFLSLCSHSNLHQDPRPPPSQGNLLKTHDFLGKTIANEETTKETSLVEKPPPPPLVEHLLPGGIGTYSISHIPYYNNLRVPIKPEAVGFAAAAAQTSSNTERNDENSNCSSYNNSGFTLWEESAAKKAKTGKENSHTVAVKESVMNLGQWTSSERPSISSTNNNHLNSFSPLSYSQPVGQKNQSFMDMFKSAKGASSQEEELDDEDEFVIKKENSPVPKGDLRIKVDGRSSNQKANTPRSKHSATEQRRRSKINDRFQSLRTLIPQSDQKRDKASFLLEVIEYIQFLQEKVNKYEGTYPGWNYDQAKLMTWERNDQRPAEDYVDQSLGATGGTAPPALVFPTKFEENNVPVSPAVLGNMKNNMEVDTATASISSTLKDTGHQLGVTANKTVPFPPVSLQQNMPTPPVRGLGISQRPDLEVRAPQPPPLTDQTKSWPDECTSSLNDKLKEQELDIEGGTISISSAYSKGLLDTLTQALQSSGVDLSQASLSVQIDMGKRSNGKSASPSSIQKDLGGATRRGRVEGNDSDHQALKTGRS